MAVTPCAACGTTACSYADPDPNTETPCWGEVRAIDFSERDLRDAVELDFEHACEGHKRFGRYTEQE